MKNLVMTIGKKEGMWALDFACDYSPKAREIVLKMFGCCHINGNTLSSGMRTINALTLVSTQTELLSNAE